MTTNVVGGSSMPRGRMLLGVAVLLSVCGAAGDDFTHPETPLREGKLPGTWYKIAVACLYSADMWQLEIPAL